MKLEILVIGKIGDRHYSSLVNDYLKRCSGRLSSEICHCRDYREMGTRLDKAGHKVALDERGTEMDSNAFAFWLKNIINSGVSRLIFCLGAAEGLNSEIKNMTDESISLSRFTLNHQLALLVIAEQLYRGISILFGEPYHKP